MIVKSLWSWTSRLVTLVVIFAAVFPVQGATPVDPVRLVANLMPVTVELYIDPVGSFDRDGNAIIRGTFTCSHLVYIYLGGTAERVTGQRTLRGGFDIELSCLGTTPWEAAIHSEEGNFHGGRITVYADGHGRVLDETAGQTWVGFVAPATVVRLTGRQ